MNVHGVVGVVGVGVVCLFVCLAGWLVGWLPHDPQLFSRRTRCWTKETTSPRSARRAEAARSQRARIVEGKTRSFSHENVGLSNDI